MANKRVSELSPITAAELAANDLFLLADISEVESKQLTVTNLTNYLQVLITGSATSSVATNALTASYLLYQGFPNGTASFAFTSSHNLTSSHALWSHTSSYALLALSSSYSNTASYALTASYSLTSSVQLVYSSAYCDYAQSASYLIYTPGVVNGTASYAITASKAITVETASFLNYTAGGNTGTASYALTTAWASQSAFLQYSGVNNGTASYALRAKLVSNADSASFLWYDPLKSNGTASYAITASNANTASFIATASHALTAETVVNVHKYFYKTDPLTISGNFSNTASLSLKITSSTAYTNCILDLSGDVIIPITSSIPSVGYVRIELGTSYPGGDFGSPAVAQQSFRPFNIITSLDPTGNQPLTGSVVMPFNLKYLATSMLTNRAYGLRVTLHGFAQSSSFVDTAGYNGYGDGLFCFIHSDASNIGVY